MGLEHLSVHCRTIPAGLRLRRVPVALTRLAVVAALGIGLAGCEMAAGAPSIALFGAYFPAWLACALAGILGAVLIRLVLIPLGIDDLLPIRLPVYVALAASIGFSVSLIGFGR